MVVQPTAGVKIVLAGQLPGQEPVSVIIVFVDKEVDKQHALLAVFLHA
jgi:hypothetical protein